MLLPEETLGRDYARADKTIGNLKANLLALAAMLPVASLLGWLYVRRWGLRFDFGGFNLVSLGLVWLLLIAGILVLIALHELTHGVFYALFCERGFASVRFGVLWRSLAPYCHCGELLKLWQYRLAAAMPFVTTALLPWAVAYLFGLNWLLLASLCSAFGAGGDAVILAMLLREKRGTLIADHPERIGAVVYRPVHLFESK